MKKPIGVVTDSHSGISKEEAEKLGIYVLPAPFYIDDKCYLEGVDMSKDEFFEKLKSGANVSTSQPAPTALMEIWDKALEEYEQIIYIPISSGLSGSYNMAATFAKEEQYEGKVIVVDNGRVATPQHQAVLDALELVKEGYLGSSIKQMLEAAKSNMVIYVAVDSMDNLKKGGRVSATTAAIATVLNIKPVLKFDIGTLDTFAKCRGFSKAKKTMIEALKNDLETIFKEYYDKKEVAILAASSASEEETAKWVAEIREAFPGFEVMCDPLACAISCHIGYGGLGIGCSCRPERI